MFNKHLNGSEWEENSDWLLLSFVKVKMVFLEAEKLGFTEIIPCKGDIRGRLTEKGFSLLNILQTK